MADIRWRGDDDGIAQVNTVTPGGTIGTETFTVTINAKIITYTATGGDAVADVVDGLVAAFNASTIPEFAEITATDSTTHMTLTADTAGVEFTQTSSATGSATCVTATSTSNSGPNVLSANNCIDLSSGAAGLPGAADSFFIEDADSSLKYGLDQSAAGTLTYLGIAAGFTGEIGLPSENTDGSLDYYEYRDRYYEVRVSTCEIGSGEGSGSGRILLDFGSVQTAVVIYSTGSAAEADFHAVRLKGTHASNTLDVLGGSVDVAPEGAETATFTTLQASGSATVRTSIGATLGTVSAAGASTVMIRSDTGLTDITAINVDDSAIVTVQGDNAVTTINCRSGSCNYTGSGTIANLNVGVAGIVDFTSGTDPVTVTNCTLAAGAQILDPGKRVTFSNAIDLGDAGLEDVTLELGKGVNVLPS
jgi:hypothetical protein